MSTRYNSAKFTVHQCAGNLGKTVSNSQLIIGANKLVGRVPRKTQKFSSLYLLTN